MYRYPENLDILPLLLRSKIKVRLNFACVALLLKTGTTAH